MERIMDLSGRILLAGLFVAGTAQKAVSPGMVEDLLRERGWFEWLVWPALAFNLAGAAALMIGWRLQIVGLALAIYCMATSYFHWVPSDGWQMSIFVKNWAIAGGLLCLAARPRPQRRR